MRVQILDSIEPRAGQSLRRTRGASRVLVDDLHAGPASFPQLAGSENGDYLFTLTGRDLLRVDLRP